MSFKSYKDESRVNWGTNDEGALRLEQINTGAMLRIADATEAMAKNHVKLIADHDMYERWYKTEHAAVLRLQRRVSAYKGQITKLKRAKESSNV